MKKQMFILLALISATIFFADNATAQAKKHKAKNEATTETEAGPYNDNGNPNTVSDPDKVQIVMLGDRLKKETADKESLQNKVAELNAQITGFSSQIGTKNTTINDLTSRNNDLQKQIVSLQAALKDTGRALTTPQMAELVKDSITTELLKNMELGMKFWEMKPEELAARYSGLNLFRERPNHEKFSSERGVFLLQKEILKWMEYDYKNTRNSADRVRLKFMFESITGQKFANG